MSLMLDPRFKNLYLVSSFNGIKQDRAIVEENDIKILYFMLLKC
jgi:hypothetical protein